MGELSGRDASKAGAGPAMARTCASRSKDPQEPAKISQLTTCPGRDPHLEGVQAWQS